jgi:glutathione peroxidase
MFNKVSVKGGDQHPLFRYLTMAENVDFKGDIRWNFEKFLVDADGVLQRRFRSQTKPTSKDVTEAIEVLMAKASS